MRRDRFAALLLGALALAGCRRQEPAPGLGRRLVAGEIAALRPSADGAYLAWLDGCAPLRGMGVPPGAASCDLRAVAVAGGEPVRVARGVTTLPGAFAWSAEGHVLAALEAQDLTTASGALVAWTPGGEPRRMGEGVSFYAFARKGRLLAFVWRGRVQLWRPGAEPETVEGVDAAATFELNPRGEEGTPLLLVRRVHSAGGELLAVTPGQRPAKAGGPVGDYGFAPGGARFAFTERSGAGRDLHVAASSAPSDKGPTLGEDVAAFAFSHDGKAIAFQAGVVPGKQGDLWVARAGEKPARLGSAVGEFRWAAAAERLAWLEGYDPRVRSGALASGAPGEKPLPLGKNVSAFELAPGGEAVAFLEHTVQGGYSVDLKVARKGEVAAVARGAFGFELSPGGQEIWLRTACTRNAEACDLLAAPLAEPAKTRRIAEGLKSFEWDPRRPTRLLLGWSREDRVALDLAVWEAERRTAVDRSALPGSAFFLAPDSRRLAYVVNDPKRPGLYLAELPPP